MNSSLRLSMLAIIATAVIVFLQGTSEVRRRAPSAPPRVACTTTVGPMDIEVLRERAPLGAERFLALVQLGFFTNMSFFRVPPLMSNPIAQFGVSPLESVRRATEALPAIQDENDVAAKRIPQQKGDFGFGGNGPHSRTFHMWVARMAFADVHPNLGANPHDVPVARVVGAEGIAALDKIALVGDMKPWGNGPDTSRMLSDPTFSTDFPGEYLRLNFPKIDYFMECSVLE